MARNTLTLYDVPSEVRAKGAASARSSIYQLLSNPHITPEQRTELLERLKWAAQWESLDIAHVLSPAESSDSPSETQEPTEEIEIEMDDPEREPQEHVVDVSDTVRIRENSD